MADPRSIATAIVTRAFATRLGLTDLHEHSRLIDVVPSYPSEVSKQRVALALFEELDAAMRGLKLDVDLDLHETTLFGDVIRRVAGGIPPRVFACPQGDVISMAPGTCGRHNVPLAAVS